MRDSAVPISSSEQGVRVSDSPLPPFTASLTFVQRHPHLLVLMGIALTLISGAAGVLAGVR